MTTVYTCDLLTSLREFGELNKQWNALADKLQSPLLRHEWLFCCAKTLHPNGSLRVFIVRKNAVLSAAAPLAVKISNGVERWEFLGVAKLYEPCGFLYDDQDALNALLSGLMAKGFPLMLQRLETESPAVQFLKDLPLKRGIVIARDTSPRLSLELPPSWDMLLKTRSANFRYDLKRKYSRAKKIGAVAAEFITPENSHTTDIMQIVAEVEGSGWKGDRGSSLHRDSLLGRFFEDFSGLAANENSLKIEFLKIDEKVIAVQLGILAYKGFWVLKMGYDEAFSQLSPGFLLTAESIRDAIRRKLVNYEFLGVAEPWEERWGPAKRAHSLVLYYPWTAHGFLALLFDGLLATKRKVLHYFRKMSGYSGSSHSNSA